MKPASPPQYPSQSPFHAGSLDPMSRFGATSRVIFAFDPAVSDEDDFSWVAVEGLVTILSRRHLSH